MQGTTFVRPILPRLLSGVLIAPDVIAVLERRLYTFPLAKM